VLKYFFIVKLALKNLLVKKTRTILTMLGIIIGVASVVSIMSLGKGAESLITGSIQRIGTSAMSVLPGASDEKGPPASVFGIVIKTLVRKDASDISKIPHVLSVTEYARGNGEVSTYNKSIPADFSGVSANYPQTEKHETLEGRFFNAAEENSSAKVAVIGMDIKDELFPNKSPVGEKIKINGISFQIIGLMKKKGSRAFGTSDNIIFVPLNTAHKVLLGTRHLNMIRLLVDKEENIPRVKERIEKTLRSNHGIKNPDSDDFSVRSLAQALDVFTSITLAIRFFLAAIASISLIVGGIGITNIMLMTVKERTQEIGLRKALGAKPKDISRQFIIEATVLTTIGGSIGILSGIFFSFFATILIKYFGYDWVFSIPLNSIIVSFAISVLVGLIFGVYPAKSAAKLNPINSLRYE
jgi:putative ABC transport system permease protein